jgi:hypothetical protein
MPKDFNQLRNDIQEWSNNPTFSGSDFVTTRMSVRTGKSDFAKKPTVRQLKNKSPSRKEIAKEKSPYWSSGGIT